MVADGGRLFRGDYSHRAPANILLIDDDDSDGTNTTSQFNNSGTYRMDTAHIMAEALTANLYDYDVYVVQSGRNGPDFQKMTNYTTLIWMFGYEWGYYPTLTRADYYRVLSFMEAGGSVWFVGPFFMETQYGRQNYTKTGTGGTGTFSNEGLAKKYLGIEEFFFYTGMPDPVNGSAGSIMAGSEQYDTRRFFDQVSVEQNPAGMFCSIIRPIAGAESVLKGDSMNIYDVVTYNDEPNTVSYDSGTWKVVTSLLDVACIANAADRTEYVGKVMSWLYTTNVPKDNLKQHSIMNWYIEVDNQSPWFTAYWDVYSWSYYYPTISAAVHTQEPFTVRAHYENHGSTNENNLAIRVVMTTIEARTSGNTYYFIPGREILNKTFTGAVASRMTAEASTTYKPTRAALYMITTNITIVTDTRWQDNAANTVIAAPTYLDDLENGTTGWTKTGAWGLVDDTASSFTPTHAWQIRRNNYQTGGDNLTSPMIDLRFYNQSFTHPALTNYNMIWFNFLIQGRMFGAGNDYVEFQMKATNMTNWQTLRRWDGNTQVGTGIANGDFSQSWYFPSETYGPYGFYLGNFYGQMVQFRWHFVKGNPISQSWWTIDDPTLWMFEEVNQAPWFEYRMPVGINVDMDVGSSLTLNATVVDVNKDSPLTLRWLENYEERLDWAGESSVTLTVPKDAPVGDKYHRGNTLSIVFAAKDDLDENSTFWNVRLLDPRPVTTPEWTGVLNIDEDVPMDVDMSSWFRDIEEQPWTVTSTGSTNIKVSTVTGSILNITNKLPNWNGEENITLRVTDSASSMANFTLRVVVRPVNDAPKIKVVQLPDALQDEQYSYNLTGTDIENDPLTWSDDTQLFDITAAGTIAFVPENADVGYHTFNITAEDPSGATNKVEFTLFVANVNDPPVLRYIPPQTAHEDQVWTLDVSEYVEDPDLLLDPEFRDRINYRDDTPKLDTNLETGLITWDSPTNDDAAEEDFFFKITVQDSKGRYAEQEVKITVVNTNDPPKIGTIQKQTLHQDAPYVYTILVTDEDLDVPSANEELTFTNDRTELFTIDATTGRIQFTPVNEQVGVWEVNITVTDVEGDSATKKVIFEVVNKNDAPVLEFIKVQQLTEDEPYELQVVATDPDLEPRLVDGQPVDPSERLEFRTNSTKVPIDRDSGMISFTPTQTEVGEFMVKITVIDRSSDARTADVLFKVANVNDPPRNLAIVGIFANQTVNAGKAIQLIGSAVDDDNPATELNYMWYAGAKVIGQTSTIQWKPEGKGMTEVKLVVSDPDGGTAEYVIPVQVKATGDGPGFTTILAFTAVVIVAAMVAVVRRRHLL